MQRGTHEWYVETAVTGTWWEPAFWETVEYQASSPWKPQRLTRAFAALKELYQARHAIAAFAWVSEPDPQKWARLRNRPIWSVLACPMRADLSGLVRLGLDVADANVFEHPELVRKLREDNAREFKGARFELRCLAAFRNAGIHVEYEALANRGGGNPDFGLKLQRQLYIDAKHAEDGAWAKEEHDWFLKLSMPADSDATAVLAPISAHVRLTPAFEQLQDDEDGRSYIRANLDRLRHLIGAAKARLAMSGGPFPAVEIIEGLIEVKVMGAPGDASNSSVMGVQTDEEREVARVVRGAVTRGAIQLPRDDLGIVLLKPSVLAPTHLLVEELQRWMKADGEGAGYPHLVGVLVLKDALYEPVPGVMGQIEHLVPVWREDTPEWIVDGPWAALSDALGMQQYEALMHRCQGRVEADVVSRSQES